jgi:hypothetical protein
MSEVNIKSTTIEKGLELAKEFLGKLIGPSIDEMGLLISDNIKFYRFKNQIKILNKAQRYIEKKGIDSQEIPIKILVPLLENASLEEDTELQFKWANMIGNMADSETNIQNNVFPYILGQISNEEYQSLEELNKKEEEHWQIWRTLYDKEKKKIELTKDDYKLKTKLKSNDEEGFLVSIEEYELSNLIRLGLIKELPPKITIEEFRTGSSENIYGEEWHNIRAEYEPHSSYHRITELGSQFIKICSEKKSNNDE